MSRIAAFRCGCLRDAPRPLPLRDGSALMQARFGLFMGGGGCTAATRHSGMGREGGTGGIRDDLKIKSSQRIRA